MDSHVISAELPPTVEIVWAIESAPSSVAELGPITAAVRRLLDERPRRLTAADVDAVDVIVAVSVGDKVDSRFRHDAETGARVLSDGDSSGWFWWAVAIAAMLERSGLSDDPVDFPITAARIAIQNSRWWRGSYSSALRNASEVSRLLRAGIDAVLAHGDARENAPEDVAFAQGGIQVGIEADPDPAAASPSAGSRAEEALGALYSPVDVWRMNESESSRLDLLATGIYLVAPPETFQRAFADGCMSAADAATIAAVHTRGADPGDPWCGLLVDAIVAWKPPAVLQLPTIII